MNSSLQEDLVAYGVMRAEAKAKTPNNKDGDPQYFGLKEMGCDDYKTDFSGNLKDMDPHMDIAVVAPENMTFDLLAPKDYSESLTLKDKSKVRSFLSKLVDMV